MTDLMLFLEFVFWLVLRCGLLILLTLCAFDILYIIDYLDPDELPVVSPLPSPT